VIVTDGGATEDFVRDEFALKIDAEPKSIGTMLDGKELTGEAFMLEPDIDDLSDILQEIYKMPSIIFSMGIQASAYARKYWNWQRSSLKMFSLLDKFYNTTTRFEADKKLTDFDDELIELGKAEYYFLKN
jgi:glycosyltransferase involved in cell wall biosynthesis